MDLGEGLRENEGAQKEGSERGGRKDEEENGGGERDKVPFRTGTSVVPLPELHLIVLNFLLYKPTGPYCCYEETY